MRQKLKCSVCHKDGQQKSHRPHTMQTTSKEEKNKKITKY